MRRTQANPWLHPFLPLGACAVFIALPPLQIHKLIVGTIKCRELFVAVALLRLFVRIYPPVPLAARNLYVGTWGEGTVIRLPGDKTEVLAGSADLWYFV